MALPMLQPTPASPGVSPDTAGTHQREIVAARRANNAKRRQAEDARRAAAPRRQSLRRVKDSKEELRRTRARGTSSATVESSTPSSTTAGRSFTVANINNGIIYLRPVVRAGNQRNRPSPDPFVFPPQTPSDSAKIDPSARSNDWEHSLYSSRPPTRISPVSPPPPDVNTDDDSKAQRPAHFTSPPRPSAHSRSQSFSTLDAHTVTTASTEPGTFKVVIDRAPFRRPKTADTGSLPFLEVPIPNYRLGTPHFSARGTAILRSSVYTRASGTEDRSTSSFLTSQRATHSFLSSRPRSDLYSPIPAHYRTTMDRIPLQPSTAPSSARVSKVPIGPQLYDALTVNPDDGAVVRFSPSGDILAATPSRLVAHITSPSFLDYELLSDFFLTFRSFLCSRDLAAYLISRLRWAVDRQDDFGRIVRVRTFVALRHWILNYFVDDFVPMYQLRIYFCGLVNSLYTDLRAREDGGGGDVKIVGELKKCWRRTCALYWDSEDGIGKDLADDHLLPGGHVESQASVEENLPPMLLPSTPPRQTDRANKVETIGSNPSDQFASRHMDWAQKSPHTRQNSLSSPHTSSQEYEATQVPLSPASEHSMQVQSCSIPMRGLNRADPKSDMPLYPHPVPHPVTARIAAGPQNVATAKKRNRPSHAHKRSGSFSDALRDHREPLSVPKSPPTNAAVSSISKMPGTLVRGGLFQPSSPYVDLKNGQLRHTRSHLEFEPVDNIPGGDMYIKQSPVTNPGVKKLFGSVRRALSSRQPLSSAPHPLSSAYRQHVTPSPRSSDPRNVSTASGGVYKRRIARPRPNVRIDILAYKVGESFKEAVNEQSNDERQRNSAVPVPVLGGFEFEFENHGSSISEDQSKTPNPQDSRIYSNITTGSKSILIMDDTGASDLPSMSGALPSPAENLPPNVELAPRQRGASINEQPAGENASTTRHSDLYTEPELEAALDRRPTSRVSVQPSIAPRRRSVSEGREQMHSFRRRGSTKTSLAHSLSLRRHASYNSGLSRYRAGTSIATFQTMSTGNDPFFLDHQPSTSAVPTRQLRRRPGGDLRAVGNVHDLETILRPHSTGSLSNHSHSVSNSVILHSDRYVEAVKENGDYTEQVREEIPKQKPVSLVDTHSSQPNLRPSFEVEVAKLAALPDDMDDDGGIESALMKLEGRYEKKSPETSPRMTLETSPSMTSPSMTSPSMTLETSPRMTLETSPRMTLVPEVYQPTGVPVRSSNLSCMPSDQDSSHTKSSAQTDDVFYRPRALPEAEGRSMYRSSGENFNRLAPATNSAMGSEDSYSSVPLLDRGISDIASSPRSRTLDTMRSSAKPLPLQTTIPPRRFKDQVTSVNSSTEYVVETDSMRRIPRDGTLPRSSFIRESFLLDDDEELSDDDNSLSHSRSDGTSHGVRSFFDDEPAIIENEQAVLPIHPMRHPPTPPLTANRLKDPLPQVDTTVFDRGLPTPGLTPTSALKSHPFGNTTPVEPAVELQKLKNKSPPPPAHLPFILAYDSETLAQQFTIVEKDALDEIDWKELIELRWKQSSPQIRDWVQYLRTQEARGVDVVIARFNIVVKWAVSECILTESIEERARCIIKYIHIATHCRRLRNYATMYQITIALLSNDVSRLKHTWALVPAAELQTLKELEALVQPLRNFYNLRVEMETATTEEGCIPFIGIYTRDLIYNAQKPAFIDAPPVDGERLVNFERHHTAAMIVKSLLRLLEASSKYTFKAEPNIISKCLWMAALGDEEITAISRTIE